MKILSTFYRNLTDKLKSLNADNQAFVGSDAVYMRIRFLEDEYADGTIDDIISEIISSYIDDKIPGEHLAQILYEELKSHVHNNFAPDICIDDPVYIDFYYTLLYKFSMQSILEWVHRNQHVQVSYN